MNSFRTSPSQGDVIRVGLADDQPLVRAGFGMLISSQSDMEVVWEASDGDEVVPAQQDARVRNATATVVLMDVQMARLDGIAATKQLIEADSQVKVIMLTVSKLVTPNVEPQQIPQATKTLGHISSEIVYRKIKF